MANKTRSSKRQIKPPARFNDHMSSAVSQKKDEMCTGTGDKGIKTASSIGMVGKGKNRAGVAMNVVSKGGKVTDESSVKEVNEDVNRNTGETKKKDLDVSVMDKDGEVSIGEGDNVVPITDKDGGKVNNEVNNGENNSVNSSANTRDNTVPKNTQRNTYARMVTKDVRIVNNRLSFVPTEISNEGNEIVIFYEDLVQKGSSQW